MTRRPNFILVLVALSLAGCQESGQLTSLDQANSRVDSFDDPSICGPPQSPAQRAAAEKREVFRAVATADQFHGEYVIEKSSARPGLVRLVHRQSGRCLTFPSAPKSMEHAKRSQLQSCADPEFQSDFVMREDQKFALKSGGLCLSDSAGDRIELENCPE